MPIRRHKIGLQISDRELERLSAMVRNAQALPRTGADEQLEGTVFSILNLPEPMGSWAARQIARFAAAKGFSAADGPVLQAFVGGFGKKLTNISNWLTNGPSVDLGKYEFGTANKEAEAWFKGSKREKKLSRIEEPFLTAAEYSGIEDPKQILRIASAMQKNWEEEGRPDIKDFIAGRRSPLLEICDWIRSKKPPARPDETWGGLAISARNWHNELRNSQNGHPSLYESGPRTGYEGDPITVGDTTMWMVEMSPDDYENEGSLMGHCVGSQEYVDDGESGKVRIFSLRDRNNFPHVTWNLRGRVDEDRRNDDIQAARDERIQERVGEIRDGFLEDFEKRNRPPNQWDLREALQESLKGMGITWGTWTSPSEVLKALNPEQRKKLGADLWAVRSRPAIADEEELRQKAVEYADSREDEAVSTAEQELGPEDDYYEEENFPEGDYVEGWSVQQIFGKEDSVPVPKYRPFLAEWFAKHGQDWPMNEDDELLLLPPEEVWEKVKSGNLRWSKAKEYLDEEHRGMYLDWIIPQMTEYERDRRDLGEQPPTTDPEAREMWYDIRDRIGRKRDLLRDVSTPDILIRCLQKVKEGGPGPIYIYEDFLDENVYNATPEQRQTLYDSIFRSVEYGDSDEDAAGTILDLPEGRQFVIDRIEAERDPIVARELVKVVSRWNGLSQFGNPAEVGQYVQDIPRHFDANPESATSMLAAADIAFSAAQALMYNPAAEDGDVAAAIGRLWERFVPLYRMDESKTLINAIRYGMGKFFRTDPPRFLRAMRSVSPGIVHEMMELGCLDMTKAINSSKSWQDFYRDDLKRQDPIPTLQYDHDLPTHDMLNDEDGLRVGPRLENELGKMAIPPETIDPSQGKLFARLMAMRMLRLSAAAEGCPEIADRMLRVAGAIS